MHSRPYSPRRTAAARALARGLAGGLAIALGAGPLPAQTGIITGFVVDAASKRPIDGAEVAVVGAGLLATSVRSGRYVIADVPPGVYALEARRLGFSVGREERVEVVADRSTLVHLVLDASPLAPQEVIAAATGSTPGAVQVTAGPPTQPPAAGLQGRVPGVTVTRARRFGGDAAILLRMPKSISKSTAPLVIVDGVVLSSFAGSTLDIEALDIESIEVLKGPAAAAEYGSRGANGVIVIRTVRGKQ